MVAVQKLTNLVIINREEPTLVGVSQDTKGKSKKSEKKSGNVGSSGVVGLSASLTSSSSSGLGENLGARPKVKHGGKGRKSNRKDNDIWHNPTRKSAKALKGQGQNLAATQECGDNNEGEGHAGLSLLRLGIGPRSKLGNRVREPGKIVSGGMSRSEFRGNMLLFFCIIFPVLIILFSDISRGSIGKSDGESASLADKTRYVGFWVVALFVAFGFWLMFNFGNVGDRKFRRRNK